MPSSPPADAPPAPSLASEPAAPPRPAPAEEPTAPGIKPASLTAVPDVPLSASDVAAAYDQLSLDAEPAGADELAAAPPTQSRAAVAPRSWLDLADPGLASLAPPPSPGAAALEALLNESELLALPPPPSSS